MAEHIWQNLSISEAFQRVFSLIRPFFFGTVIENFLFPSPFPYFFFLGGGGGWGGSCPSTLPVFLEKPRLTGSLSSCVKAVIFSDIAQSKQGCVIVRPSLVTQYGICWAEMKVIHSVGLLGKS